MVSFKLPYLGVCVPSVLELQGTFHTVVYFQLGQIQLLLASVRVSASHAFPLIPPFWLLLNLPARFFLFPLPGFKILSVTLLFLCCVLFKNLINSIIHGWQSPYLYLQHKPFCYVQLPTWHPALGVSQSPKQTPFQTTFLTLTVLPRPHPFLVFSIILMKSFVHLVTQAGTVSFIIALLAHSAWSSHQPHGPAHLSLVSLSLFSQSAIVRHCPGSWMGTDSLDRLSPHA